MKYLNLATLVETSCLGSLSTFFVLAGSLVGWRIVPLRWLRVSRLVSGISNARLMLLRGLEEPVMTPQRHHFGLQGVF